MRSTYALDTLEMMSNPPFLNFLSEKMMSSKRSRLVSVQIISLGA